MDSFSLDARRHLQVEMSWLLDSLYAHLDRQRRRGRTPAADAVRGLVIEEGEAEGLLNELAEHWNGTPAKHRREQPHTPNPRREATELIDSAVRQGAFLPLRHASAVFSLTDTEYDALLLALAPELDIRFGRLFAYLNDHVGHTRPTLGLALNLGLSAQDGHHTSALEIIERPLFRDGLVELEGDGPLPGRALRVTRELAQRLSSDGRPAPSKDGIALVQAEPGLLERLELSAAVREAATLWAENARRRPAPPSHLLLAGSGGSGRATLAHGLASAAGLPLLAVRLTRETQDQILRIARRDARWFGAALLLKIAGDELEWAQLWYAITTLELPVLVSLSHETEEEAARNAPEQTALIELGEPDSGLRERLWRALPQGFEQDEASVEALAARFRFNPGRITQVIRRAESDAMLQRPGHRRLTGAGLNRAARAVGRSHMGPLAQFMPCPYRPHDLVVPPQVQAELDLALAWVRQQGKVLEEWGFKRRVAFGYGLGTLFSGRSGTGKTMAAQVLARAAAYLAAEAEAPIGMAHLRQALRRELRKKGRVVDERELEVLGP